MFTSYTCDEFVLFVFVKLKVNAYLNSLVNDLFLPAKKNLSKRSTVKLYFVC